MVACLFILNRENQMHDEVFRLCYKTCWCVQYWTSYGGMYTKLQPFLHCEDILYKPFWKNDKTRLWDDKHVPCQDGFFPHFS